MVRSRSSRSGRRRSAGHKSTFVPITVAEPEVFKETLLTLAEHGNAEFDGKVKVLRDVLRTRFPPQILATLSGWGLFVGVSDEGTAQRSMLPEIQQHHLELLQALALQVPEHEWGREPASSTEIQVVIDTLLEVADIFAQRRLVALRKDRTRQERAVLLLQEMQRAHTQRVRNWGHFSEVLRIATELYSPLDSRLREHRGFGASDLLEVVRQVLAIYEERMNERFRTLRRVFQARSVREMVHQFFECHPGLAGDPEEYLASLPPKTTIEEVQNRLIECAERWYVKLCVVDLAQVCVRSGRDLETTRRILDVLSLRPGCLCSVPTEHLFLDNPVWHTPGMKIGDEYFFAMPQVVFSFIHPIMGRLFDDKELKARLDKRRADYLEEEVARIVSTVLPQAQTRTGQVWSWEGQQYETDVLTTLDRALLIVEAKSASLTPEGLRGARKRMQRHVRELVFEPSKQSARLRDILQRAKDGDEKALRVAHALNLDPMALDTIIRVSVTLEDFSLLSSAEHALEDAGWTSSDFDLAPTLGLADFACVAEILDSPIRFIHYLSERGRLQRTTQFFGYELDYLGFYLETGFNAWDLEGDKHLLLFNGMSREVDHYYTSRDAGVAVSKPRPRSHHYFEELVARLSQSRPQSWTTMALDILRAMSVSEQEQTVRALEKLRREVPRTYRDPHHICSVQFDPPPTRDAMILFFVYPPQRVEQRYAAAEQLVNEALERTGRRRCVLIGRRTDGWDELYQFIGLAREPK